VRIAFQRLKKKERGPRLTKERKGESESKRGGKDEKDMIVIESNRVGSPTAGNRDRHLNHRVKKGKPQVKRERGLGCKRN